MEEFWIIEVKRKTKLVEGIYKAKYYNNNTITDRLIRVKNDIYYDISNRIELTPEIVLYQSDMEDIIIIIWIMLWYVTIMSI